MPTRSAPIVLERADLGGRLEARAADREVDAVVQRRAELVGGRVQAARAARGRRRREAREARADGLVVRPDERVEALHVDVVGEGDEAARAGLGAQRPGRVGEHEDLGAEQPQRAHRGRAPRSPRSPRRRASGRGSIATGVPSSVPSESAPACPATPADAEAGQLGVGDRRPRSASSSASAPSPEPSTSPTRGANPGARAGRRRRPRRAHPRLSGPNDSGSSSASDVVRRTRSRSARWIGASGPANSRSRWRQPPHGEHSSALGAATTTSTTAAAPARHHRAERRRLRALALRVGGVLDVRARVAAAVVGAHGGADGEVRVRRVGARRRLAGERERAPGRASPARSGVGVGAGCSASSPIPSAARSWATCARSRERSESGSATASSSRKRAEPLDLVEVDAHGLPQQQPPPLLDHDVDAERSPARRARRGSGDRHARGSSTRAPRRRPAARRRSGAPRPAPPRAASAARRRRGSRCRAARSRPRRGAQRRARRERARGSGSTAFSSTFRRGPLTAPRL